MQNLAPLVPGRTQTIISAIGMMLEYGLYDVYLSARVGWPLLWAIARAGTARLP
jgi:hypothetical protein